MSVGGDSITTTSGPAVLSLSKAEHAFYAQHRISNSPGVGQEMFYMFNNSSNVAAAYSSIYTELGANTAGSHSGRMGLRVAINGSLTTALLINNDGNIGIGTTSPGKTLHVYGTAKIGTGSSTSGNALTINNGSSNQVNITHGDSSDWGMLLGFGDGSISGNYHGTNHAAIINVQYAPLHLGTNNTSRFNIDSNGHLLPSSDNTYNLGSTSYRFANIYTADLNLSNRDSHNDVDGTWGEWTIQEGEEKLFLLNRRNGKKYEFVLKEIE